MSRQTRLSARSNIRYELQPDFVHDVYRPIVEAAVRGSQTRMKIKDSKE
jgi:hypothetical protein